MSLCCTLLFVMSLGCNFASKVLITHSKLFYIYDSEKEEKSVKNLQTWKSGNVSLIKNFQYWILTTTLPPMRNMFTNTRTKLVLGTASMILHNYWMTLYTKIKNISVYFKFYCNNWAGDALKKSWNKYFDVK